MAKGDNRQEGHPDQSGWPENNRHYMVAVLAADEFYDFETGLNRGDGGDVFHEDGRDSLGASTSTWPNTVSYQYGNIQETGITITNIKNAEGNNIQFDIGFENGSPTAAPDSCQDAPDWEDSDGISCSWYVENDREGCPDCGGNWANDAGVDAHSACCWCGGGNDSDGGNGGSSPTPGPTPDPSPDPTPGDGDDCQDLRGWLDSDNYGCEWYEENDAPGCPECGEWWTNSAGVDANSACCHCGGGSSE